MVHETEGPRGPQLEAALGLRCARRLFKIGDYRRRWCMAPGLATCRGRNVPYPESAAVRYPKRIQYKHAKSQYRVRSWAEYETDLQRRGDVTVESGT